MGPETALIGSTIFSAATSIIGGIGQNASASYNAKIAERNAEQARLDAAAEAERKRAMGQRVAGRSRAAAAASGLSFEGSAAEVTEDALGQVELDALTSIWQGDVAAGRYRAQAASLRAQGRSALIGGFLGAGGQALGGLEKWYRYEYNLPPEQRRRPGQT